MNSYRVGTEGEVIAIDGITLRRSLEKSRNLSSVYMVSVFSIANGMVLGQGIIQAKSDGFTVMLVQLNFLRIERCLATMDAMGYHADTARNILDRVFF